MVFPTFSIIGTFLICPLQKYSGFPPEQAMEQGLADLKVSQIAKAILQYK